MGFWKFLAFWELYDYFFGGRKKSQQDAIDYGYDGYDRVSDGFNGLDGPLYDINDGLDEDIDRDIMGYDLGIDDYDYDYDRDDY